MFVDTVNPQNTSKRCNECGNVRDDNRCQDEFECQRCGKNNHADYNAAKNVAELYLPRGHQPFRGRSISQYAFNSGLKTPS
ncbi:zinc ribbon domain-containing protein [Haloquadratum walsbyi]|uniref:zinc ribbon domain-containing protein n=1 Tax=Haloquadratum walsbyi TaxID=293091 RepID=UPI00373FDE3D